MKRTPATTISAGGCALLCVAGSAFAAPRSGDLGTAFPSPPPRSAVDAVCPIEIRLFSESDSCAIGENFLMTCEFTNTTSNTIQLHAVDLDLLINPLWVRTSDGPPTRSQRIGLDAREDRPGSNGVIELGPLETLKTRILSQGETSRPFVKDSGVLHLTAEVGPIRVQGITDNSWTLKTNTMRIVVRAPNDRDRSALTELSSIEKDRADRGLAVYLTRLEQWLAAHPDSPLSPGVHRAFVQGWSARLNALKRSEFEAPDALFGSLRFCLERGAPYSNVVGRDYLEFLYAKKQWTLIELAARRIHDRAKVSRLSDRAEFYLGAWGALLDTHAFADMDRPQKERLRAPLLMCLRRSLESGNQYAIEQAPHLLKQLEQMSAWDVLGQVAEWTESGCTPNVDVSRYIDIARQHTER